MSTQVVEQPNDTIDAAFLEAVQPGDTITRDGRKYAVTEPSQVAAVLKPVAAKAQGNSLVKHECSCTPARVIYMTRRNAKLPPDSPAEWRSGVQCMICAGTFAAGAASEVK